MGPDSTMSLLYRLAISLWLVILGVLFRYFTARKRANIAATPSRGTYRIRNIPAHYTTAEESRKFIESILSTKTKPCTINVRSFASNIDDNPIRMVTTRTVTFDLGSGSPLALKPNPQKEWSFDHDLIIDTHFTGFTVLSSPQYGDHKFDLIAISGLGSHAWGSFKKRGAKSMWLADKLPRKLPGTRIMIYGYQSPIRGTKSRQTLQDIAKTFSNHLVKIRRSPDLRTKSVPLVFLSHSLGGLVVKQALINLSKRRKFEPEIQEFFQSVYAMLFFGVPCKGLDAKRLGLAAMAQGQPTDGFLSDLRQDSPMVSDLARDFVQVFDSRHWVKIYSFHETTESATAVVSSSGIPSMNGPTEYWVDKDAAFNGRETERKKDETYSIPINTDHSGLVKCNEEETFLTISNVLEGIDWKTAEEAIELCKMQDGEAVPGYREVGREFRVTKEDRVETAEEISGQGQNEQLSADNSLSAELEGDCLRSLTFKNMDFRQRNIRQPLANTCEWLFSDRNYVDWCNRESLHLHGGLLWIKGKPGSGKSTLMKEACRRAVQSTTHVSGESAMNLVIAFFFNGGADGGLEMSSYGLLRALTFQLVEGDRDSLLELVPVYSQKLKMILESEYGQPKPVKWAQTDLEDFLRQQLTTSRRRIDVFIDALDECNEEDARDIVRFFREITFTAYAQGATLNVCLSSRHYPTISVAKCPEIWVQNHNHGDIRKYIFHSLSISNLTQDDHLQGLANEIVQKASGIFLWVMLVVQLLKVDFDKGRSLSRMRERLREIPGTLQQLFCKLFERIEGEDLEDTIRLFQWVLLAERRLSPMEINSALDWRRMNQKAPAASWHEWQLLDQEPVRTSAEINRRILDLSKGLVEISGLNLVTPPPLAPPQPLPGPLKGYTLSVIGRPNSGGPADSGEPASSKLLTITLFVEWVKIGLADLQTCAVLKPVLGMEEAIKSPPDLGVEYFPSFEGEIWIQETKDQLEPIMIEFKIPVPVMLKWPSSSGSPTLLDPEVNTQNASYPVPSFKTSTKLDLKTKGNSMIRKPSLGHDSDIGENSASARWYIQVDDPRTKIIIDADSFDEEWEDMSSSTDESIDSSDTKRTVQFIHETVREFFQAKGFELLTQEAGNVDHIAVGHQLLNRTCFDYLCCSSFPSVFNPLPVRLSGQYSLGNYSAFSAIHGREVERRGAILDHFLHDPWKSQAVLLMRSSDEQQPSTTQEDDIILLEFLCHSGFYLTAQRLLEISDSVYDFPVNSRTSTGSTPLHIVLRGFIPVSKFDNEDNEDNNEDQSKAQLVEALLRMGADVNAHDDNGESPLDIAKLNPFRGGEVLVNTTALLEHYGKGLIQSSLHEYAGLDGDSIGPDDSASRRASRAEVLEDITSSESKSELSHQYTELRSEDSASRPASRAEGLGDVTGLELESALFHEF